MGKDADFKARIECSLLRGIASSINTLVDEAKFVIGKKKWTITVVDSEHVAMMKMEIDVSNFEEYWCKTEGEIGVDIDKLLDAIKHIKDRDIVDIRTEMLKTTKQRHGEEVKEEVWKVIVSDGLCSRCFNFIDTTGMSDPKLPKLELKTVFEITWADFCNILKRFQSISDHVQFRAFKDGLEILAEGDTDECHVKKPKALLVSYEFESEPKRDEKYVRSIFPLDNLTHPFSGSKIRSFKPLFNHERWLNVCKFSMDDDYPLKIEAERNGVSILFLLAPRIESE